mgnify:CR=1 FL=1
MDCLIEVSQLWTLDSAVYGPCLVWLLGQLMQILGGLSAIYKLHLQQRAACRLAGSSATVMLQRPAATSNARQQHSVRLLLRSASAEHPFAGPKPPQLLSLN